MFKVPEKYRLRFGPMESDDACGNNGAFKIGLKDRGTTVVAFCIASDGFDWEHVSITLATTRGKPLKKCPSWEQMCRIKSLFWGEEDVVFQFHPSKDNYINNHKYCLHLWRRAGINETLPSSILIGLKNE